MEKSLTLQILATREKTTFPQLACSIACSRKKKNMWSPTSN